MLSDLHEKPHAHSAHDLAGEPVLFMKKTSTPTQSAEAPSPEETLTYPQALHAMRRERKILIVSHTLSATMAIFCRAFELNQALLIVSCICFFFSGFLLVMHMTVKEMCFRVRWKDEIGERNLLAKRP